MNLPHRGRVAGRPGSPRAGAGARAGRAAIVVAASLALTAAVPLLAGEADVVDARATALGDGRYRIDATVRHADTGWEHYANRWDVLAPDGTLLGSRELLHPHVDEQPFTRSLTLEIPAGIERVTLRANDSEHGEGGAAIEIDLPR